MQYKNCFKTLKYSLNYAFYNEIWKVIKNCFKTLKYSLKYAFYNELVNEIQKVYLEVLFELCTL
jgi:hypothetical protein